MFEKTATTFRPIVASTERERVAKTNALIYEAIESTLERIGFNPRHLNPEVAAAEGAPLADPRVLHLQYTRSQELSEAGLGITSLQLGDATDQFGGALVRLKQEILWRLLDPELKIVDRASSANLAVSDYLRERLHLRLAEILEQKVLQNPRYEQLELNLDDRDAGLNLLRVIGWDEYGNQHRPIDVVAWARRTLGGLTFKNTLRRMFAAEEKRGNLRLDDFSDIDGAARGSDGEVRSIFREVDRTHLPASAEAQLLSEMETALEAASDSESEYADRVTELSEQIREAAREQLRARKVGDREAAYAAAELETQLREDLAAFTADGVMERWESDANSKRGVEKIKIDARAVMDMVGLPDLQVPGPLEAQEALEAIRADETLAARSLKAFYDLANGEPTWDQLGVPDVLFDLWATWSLAQMSRVLGMDSRVPHLLAEAALTLPPRPGRDKLRATREVLHRASSTTGWVPLVNKLVASYVAGNFAVVSDFDYRSDVEAKRAEAREAAEQWPLLAAEVLDWPNSPAGNARTPEDVAEWVGKVLAAA